VRQVRDRFTKVANNDKILIISISPLVLAWHTIYDGDDKDAITHCNDGEGGGGISNGEFEIDTLDTLDNDKNGIIGNEAATDTITATDSVRNVRRGGKSSIIVSHAERVSMAISCILKLAAILQNPDFATVG